MKPVIQLKEAKTISKRAERVLKGTSKTEDSRNPYTFNQHLINFSLVNLIKSI